MSHGYALEGLHSSATEITVNGYIEWKLCVEGEKFSHFQSFSPPALDLRYAGSVLCLIVPPTTF